VNHFGDLIFTTSPRTNIGGGELQLPPPEIPSLCVLFYFFTFFQLPHKHFLYLPMNITLTKITADLNKVYLASDPNDNDTTVN